jgi:hypothetical protein
MQALRRLRRAAAAAAAGELVTLGSLRAHLQGYPSYPNAVYLCVLGAGLGTYSSYKQLDAVEARMKRDMAAVKLDLRREMVDGNRQLRQELQAMQQQMDRMGR